MAAKNDKTSKTARVMSLLSKKPDSAAPGEEAEASVPPIVSSMAPDVAVSSQIKNALEGALEDRTAPAQERPAPDPVRQVEPEPVPEPEPVQQIEPEPAPEPEPVQHIEPEPAPEPKPVQHTEPEAPPEVRFQEPLHPLNPGYINVMQVLVEEKAPKYAQMFGLCSCDRCLEDVKALTLNNLPSKYVVLEPGDRIPRLTVYAGRFASDITAQLLQACKLVMAHPHHGR